MSALSAKARSAATTPSPWAVSTTPGWSDPNRDDNWFPDFSQHLALLGAQYERAQLLLLNKIRTQKTFFPPPEQHERLHSWSLSSLGEHIEPANLQRVIFSIPDAWFDTLPVTRFGQFTINNPFVSAKEPSTNEKLVTALIDSILTEPPHPDPLKSYESLNTPNWDGYGAEPITAQTLSYARRLLRLIPDNFGQPDIAPAGDGSVALEWHPDTGRVQKLFLDIGPGEHWSAYWKMRNGEFGRLPCSGLTLETQQILETLFNKLSK